MAATGVERVVCVRVGASFETWRDRYRRSFQRMVVDRSQWFGFAAGVAGDRFRNRELCQLALRS